VFVQNAGYQQRVNFGYDYKKVITVSIQGAQDYERLKNALSAHPNVSRVAVAHNHLGLLNSFAGTIRLGGREWQSNVYEVGAGYFEAMGLPLVAGRDFREGSEGDNQSAVVVDRNFVGKHQLAHPLGTSITYQGQSYLVVGVAENHLSSFFDKGSLHKDHLYRVARPEQYRVLVVRTGGGSVAQTQRDVARQWKGLFPGRPLGSDLQEDIVFRGANEYNRNLKRVFLFLTDPGLPAFGIGHLLPGYPQRAAPHPGNRGAESAGRIHPAPVRPAEPGVCRDPGRGRTAGRGRWVLADEYPARRPVRATRTGRAGACPAERPAGVRARHLGSQRQHLQGRPGQPGGQPEGGVNLEQIKSSGANRGSFHSPRLKPWAGTIPLASIQ
jgi:hypothetical protein